MEEKDLNKQEVTEGQKDAAMTYEKVLGKIATVEFGVIKDYPFMLGLQLGFKLSDGCGVFDGGKYTVNLSPNCKWENKNRETEVTKIMDFVNKILKDANANYVSELLNKPVEVTLDGNRFADFRILTEVL